MPKPVDFKPSDLDLFTSFPPFVGTFQKSEAEATAAIIVIALVEKGDSWRPIAWSEVGEVLSVLFKVSPDDVLQPPPRARLALDIASNPFLRPKPSILVERGFCRWTDQPGGTIEFTDEGLLRLADHVREIPLAATPRPAAGG